MDKSIYAIAKEANVAAEKNGGTILERFYAAKKVTKDHPSIKETGRQFLTAAFGVLETYDKKSYEYKRIMQDLELTNNVVKLMDDATKNMGLPNDLSPYKMNVDKNLPPLMLWRHWNKD